MIWWSLTIAPFHTYHPTPPRVPSRDRSRERRGGERSRRIDPDLWVFAGVIGVIILNQPKKLGVKNSWLPYFWGVYCRASWWNYQLPPPKPQKKNTMKNGFDDFSTFTSKPPKQGSWKNGSHFFREDCPGDFCKSKWCYEFRKNSPSNSHVNMGGKTMSAPQKSKS